MRCPFGPVRQLGFVTADLDKAMAYWTGTLGVGPFFVLHDVEFEDYHYRGRAADSPVCSFGIAQWGELQLELIQQHNDAPSVYREFLSAGRSGIQHMSAWFAERDSYEAARAEGIGKGMALAQESRAEKGRFCYFETGRPDIPHLELAEGLAPNTKPFMERVAEAARDWDGSDPVRLLRGRQADGKEIAAH